MSGSYAVVKKGGKALCAVKLKCVKGLAYEAKDATGSSNHEGVCQYEADACSSDATQKISGQKGKAAKHCFGFGCDGQQSIAADAQVDKAIMQEVGSHNPAARAQPPLAYCANKESLTQVQSTWQTELGFMSGQLLQFRL